MQKTKEISALTKSPKTTSRSAAKYAKNKTVRRGAVTTQQRTSVTQQKIIKAALQEFAHKGYTGATLRGIARRAKVADPLIHYHFKGKEALWQAVADQIFGEMHAHSDSAVSQANVSDPVKQMRLRMRDLLDFQIQKPELHHLTAPEYQKKSSRLQYLIDTFYGERYENAIAGIRNAQKAGAIPMCDPNMMYFVVVGLASLPVQRAAEIEALTGHSIDDPKTIESYWKLVDALLFEGKHL